MKEELPDNRLSLLEDGISYSMVQDICGTPVLTPERLEYALRQLNLLGSHELVVEYKDVDPWHRGGAETCVAIGELDIDSAGEKQKRQFIAKAAVTFPTKPQDAAESWRQRISLLTLLGVNCPEVYSMHKAVLYQELLQGSFEQYWAKSSKEVREALVRQLIRIAAVLDACGFRPISFTYDLMMRNDTICIVDVGSDLGPWHFSMPAPVAFEQLLRSLYVQDFPSRELESEYQACYEQTQELIRQDVNSII